MPWLLFIVPDFNLDFPRAYGEPPISAIFKAEPEDFYVEECLGFEPSGAGEHLYLFIEKRDRNTQQVAEQLAQAVGIAAKDVSYAGLKDRRAVTRQWFSLYLPKPTDMPGQVDASVKVLRSARHHKKLRRGEHRANRFRIRLKRVEGDRVLLEERLQQIQRAGVPNYFGEQRFGHGASNLHQVESFLQHAKGKQQGFQDRLRVSAMRSWLFNQVLAERVRLGTWQSRMEGDAPAEISGPLWGRGRPASSGEVLACEQAVLGSYPGWCHFLEHCGLQQERRALLLLPAQLYYQWHDDQLELGFELPAGSYATVLLREIAVLWSGVAGERGIVGPDHEAAELGEAAWQK